MEITITWQGFALAGGVIAAATAIVTLIFKFVRWVDRQKKQDTDLQELREHHDEDINAIQDELTMLTYGVLACLKGLQEQGCNGPVTEAINKIEKYINRKAHHQKEVKGE